MDAELDEATRSRIAELIDKNPVVLFMKGTPSQPQCGFSAQVVQMLDTLVPDYTTCDVLADPEIRSGIKVYSSWPTIPQLYVRGEFVGGCDIVGEMYSSGELHEKLGLERPSGEPPSLTITDAAADALRQLAEQRPEHVLHLTSDARYQHGMYFGPEQPGQVVVESNGIRLHMDPLTAQRSEGVQIDAVQTDQGPGFQIHNPNAPSPVKQLPPQELKAWIDEEREFVFLDARTVEERETARIEGTRLLDESVAREIEALPRDTPIVIHCHHGGRSQAAAEHFAALGFTEVYNLVGGIDAWSEQVDPQVPRY